MWYTHALPTTLDEALQIIEQLQTEIAALKQQIADLTAHRDQAEPKQASPVNASVPKREPKVRRKRDPQHHRGCKRHALVL